ncbi:thioesterase [Nitritalea halalkaliphila LW7]|uniref:Thioesterase n=1 Tax=Nitritalea halalkaliphila LW7 TaxID=1189621 RepID=I5BT99_9BACT|nr:thioesterase [Nitritalea halalkaliphila LW7]
MVDPKKQHCVGLEINANHLKSVRSGEVTGVCSPIHLGKKTQVWEIKIFTPDGELSCISRITLAVIDKK